MTRQLRVGVDLPPQDMSPVAGYLEDQPLLPIWELVVESAPATTYEYETLDALVTSPRRLDQPKAKAATPTVIIVEQVSRGDLAPLIGIPNIRGMILPDDPPETLAFGVAAAVSHGVWLAHSVWARLGPERELPSTLATLTPTEHEIIAFVALGMTNVEIAHARHVQPSTIKYHVDSLRRKTGTRSRVELAVVAHRLLDSHLR